jgi:hypothetical protein
VSEPFRDPMAAALSRADQLAEENSDLRDEIRRLREGMSGLRERATNDLDAGLADEALRVLDRLAADSERRPPVGSAQHEAVRAADRLERASEAELLDGGHSRPAQPHYTSAPITIVGWGPRSVVLVGVLSFLLGIAFAACVHGL